MIRTIFLDMDGVLCDFVTPAFALFGVGPAEVERLYAGELRGEYSLELALGITSETIWERIDSAGEDFWADLELHDWVPELLNRCRAIAPTMILSTPSDHPSSHAGKHRWLKRHFGLRFRDYFLGWNKEECARPEALLIDDHVENCWKFRERGGQVILFPRPWNTLDDVAADPCVHVFRELDALTQRNGQPAPI